MGCFNPRLMSSNNNSSFFVLLHTTAFFWRERSCVPGLRKPLRKNAVCIHPYRRSTRRKEPNIYHPEHALEDIRSRKPPDQSFYAHALNSIVLKQKNARKNYHANAQVSVMTPRGAQPGSENVWPKTVHKLLPPPPPSVG